jgi:hypothetical protein
MPYTIADYRSQYAIADTLCQEVQSFRNAAGIPAMNELRNAGHHFLKAVDDTGALVDERELDSAVGHARRAIYEATEAGIITALSSVTKFRNDFQTIELAPIVPNYVDRMSDCRVAQQALDTGRQATFNRAQDHRTRIDSFRTLRAFVSTLDICRDDANKAVNKQRKDTRRFTIGTILAVAALLATVLFGVWAVFGNVRFWEGDMNEQALNKQG